MYDIITIGSATRDVFLESEKIKVKKSTTSPTGFDECVPMGAKIELKEITFDTGGGATNAAVTFANQKFKTASVCRIADDTAGLEILNSLKSRGVSTRFLQYDKKYGSAYSLILLTSGGERSILVYRGASQKISSAEIPWKNIKTEWLYISSLAGDLKLIKSIWKFAEKNQIKIGWNPGSRELDWGLTRLTPFIRQTEFFTVNTEEAARLTKEKTGNIRGQAKKLKKICQYLSLTDGPKGAYAWRGEEAIFALPLKIKRINATGAGDAFGSGFVAGLIAKNRLEYAAKLATLNSNMVITRMGAKNGLLKNRPTKKELKRVKLKKINF